MKNFIRSLSVGAVCLAASLPALGDEGMWLLNKPPIDQLKSKYKFEPTAEWLEHMQKSAVRIGASGSLVSPDGLIMTNHHVGSDSLAKLSSEGNDLLEKGFYAKTRAEEAKCPDLEVGILWTIQDVTDRVNGATKPDMPAADANTARRKMMSTIEKENQDATGLQSQIVTLYQGGRYHLYGYKRFTDVRLVFAPEQAIAFFGGDTDNFEYPRFDLDCCFFRIYENDKPLKSEHYLKWSAGAAENDLAFVFGHPGRTSRLFTVDHLRHIRDESLPRRLRNLCTSEIYAQVFAGRGGDNARIAKEELFGIANGRKNLAGQIEGLLDPALFARKAEAEAKLHAAWKSGSPAGAPDPWERIAAAEKVLKSFSVRREGVGAPFGTQLSGMALTLVRLADEKPKPNADRLREFRDTALPMLFRGLYSPAPIYENEQIDNLAFALKSMAYNLGADDPLVVKALAGLQPRLRAEQLIKGTKLKDIAERKRLAEGGTAAIADSNDPMIQLAKLFDAESRQLRKTFEDEVEAVERDSYAAIANAKFAAEGESVYPDATGTLRMSFGPIIGYMDEGQQVKPFTTFDGLYKRAAERKGQPGFDLPQRWSDRKSKLKLETPFNFACTADIIGGNSGSPVVNKAGEVIGLIFDGNLQSLTANFGYEDRMARAVAVDSRALIEALRSVYDAGTLADEITGAKK